MRRLSDERGATAVLVAILTLVLFGFAAFAVDVGALYQERRELQNGADAAALAAAQECAQWKALSIINDCAYSAIPTKCLTDPSLTGTFDPIVGLADDYADANANDRASAIECLQVDLVAQSVTVTTLTEAAGTGANTLPHWFAPILEVESSVVRARATAAWGIPDQLRIFPLAFCDEEYYDHVPPYGPPEYDVIYGTGGDCHVPTGLTYPGGFGWLDPDDPDLGFEPTTCRVTALYDEWYDGDNGVGLQNAEPWRTCERRLQEVVASPEPVILIPIFDDWRQVTPGADEFHLAGFGAFWVTAYNFGGWAKSSAGTPCGSSPSDRCIRGYFTKSVTLEAARFLVARGDFGLTAVKLTR